MEKTATPDVVLGQKKGGQNAFVSAAPAKVSVVGSMIEDYLLKPSLFSVVTVLNSVMIYLLVTAIVAGQTLHPWHALVYVAVFYMIQSWRKSWTEKHRRINAHRIPFFADALANSLAVGGTLEQAFQQSIYYLRGDLKREFEKVIAKSAFGNDLGKMLRDLDAKFPKTGLKYLIALLDEYKDLGIGISPLLKQMAEGLKEKEEAEEKIRTILAGGSSYAKLCIGIFGATFLLFSFLLKDQISTLLQPSLKPVLFFLLGWACIGMFITTRITSLQFANHQALRPYIASFMTSNEWSVPNLLSYSGLHKKLQKCIRIALYFPLILGFIISYVVSWYIGEPIVILIGFLIGVMLGRFGTESFLKGLVEDQLIETVEMFPDFLQVYIIGLNSGLNSFMAFRFAGRAFEGVVPEVFRREIQCIKIALECGENYTKSWRRFADRLPFESIVDFAEMMIISPMHGESIVKSLVQMMKSYQSKKIALVEKKATALGQYVIPIIVLSFFPLFLFAIFAPLWVKITVLFQG